MTRFWRLRWLALSLVFLSSVALAIEKWTAFDAPTSRGIMLPQNYNGFHFRDRSDSSQGWMHLIHLKDGGWVTVLFTVANIGPYKMTNSIGILYLHPNGTKYTCSELWPDGESFHKPAPGKYWIGLNKSAFGGRYPDFSVKLNDGGCKGEIAFKSIVPSYMQGSGKATFYADKSAYWSVLQISPRASAKGYIQFPQKRVEIEGDAYLEEVSAEIMVPVMADRWAILRTVNGPYTINLFDITVDKKNFGGGHIRTLLVARDNTIVMGTSQFNYEPKGGRKHSESGISVPESFTLSARDGAATLTGTVKTGKILDSLALMSRLPRVARIFGSALYGSPWQFRSAAEYDLVLKEGDKETPLKGLGFKELHFYDN